MQSGYKPNWKKISLLALGVVVVAGGIFFLVKKYPDKKSLEYSHEALVQVFDQRSSDPKEDMRTNLKKGDVLAVFPKDHNWSETERKSYLILKMSISPEEAANLVKSDEKENETVTSGGKTVISKEVVRLRAYRIKIEKLKFSSDEIWKGQPFEKKVFGGEIIEKKSQVK